MVRISDILRRGQGEEEEPQKKKPEEPKVRKEKVSAKIPEKKIEQKKISFKAAQEEAKKEIPPESVVEEVKAEKPSVSQVEISKVMMERTKVGRPKPEDIYEELLVLVKEIFAKGERNEPIEGKEIVVKIDRVVEQMALAGDGLLGLTVSSTPDNYLYSHVINICLISIGVGLGSGYNKSRLIELGISGLLHDIGMVKVTDIVQQPKRLTEKEYEEVKQHPIYGVEILEKANDLTKVAIYVTHEQHERMDGTGYPRGLEDDEISEYARIVGLVDVYEALTHSRPHRKKMLPHEAMKKILKDKVKFDPQILKVLIKEIGIYPIGSWVELNTGEASRIIRVNKDYPLHPIVNVIFASGGRKLDGVKSIDLVKHPTIYIKRPLDDNELEARFTDTK